MDGHDGYAHSCEAASSILKGLSRAIINCYRLYLGTQYQCEIVRLISVQHGNVISAISIRLGTRITNVSLRLGRQMNRLAIYNADAYRF